MLQEILKQEQIGMIMLMVLVLLLFLAQLRTNYLLKTFLRLRTQKREQAKSMKEEVKKGSSPIPVVKFEKPKASEGTRAEKNPNVDAKELAVLQEMMTEFFG